METPASDPQKDINLELRQAARRGALAQVKALIKKGANPNSSGKSKRTALHQAAIGAHVDSYRLLQKLDARDDLLDDANKTASQYLPPDRTIVFNSFNSSGTGDAIYALRAHRLCQSMMLNPKLKTIITIDREMKDKFKKATKGYTDSMRFLYYNVNNKVTTLDLTDDDATAKPAVIVFFVRDVLSANFQVYQQIRSTEGWLKDFISKADLYLNFGTALADERNVPYQLVDPEKCRMISFTEFGPLSNKYFEKDEVSEELREFIRKNMTEISMGVLNGQAGMLLDRQIMEICDDPDLQLDPNQFDNTELAQSIMTCNGVLSCGYVQALCALRAAIGTLSKAFNKESVLVLTNTSMLNDNVLRLPPFDQFAQIKLFDNNGKLCKTLLNEQSGNGHHLFLFDFAGCSNPDKHLYFKMSDVCLGSGDNSFCESISANNLFMWDVPQWKTNFVDHFIRFLLHHNLVAMAKFLFFDTLASGGKLGLGKQKLITTMQDYFASNIKRLKKEVAILRTKIRKHANFETTLLKLLKDPSCNDVLLADSIETPRLSKNVFDTIQHNEGKSKGTSNSLVLKGAEEESPVEEAEIIYNDMKAQAEIPVDEILRLSKPADLDSQLVSLRACVQANYATTNVELTMAIVQDNANQLSEGLAKYPYFDITQQFTQDKLLIELAAEHGAQKCLKIIRNEYNKLGIEPPKLQNQCHAEVPN